MTAAVADLPEQALEFSIGDERYCLALDAVEEIVRAATVTPLPDTPAAVAGVMDLRGETTTILDPAHLLDVPGGSTGGQVVVLDDADRRGWLVDRVHRVRSLRDVTVDTVPESPLVNGVVSDGDRFTIWVDPDTVGAAVTV